MQDTPLHRDADSPAWQDPDYVDHAQVWEDCRAVAGGTTSVRAGTTRYLPRFPAEHPDDYRERLLGIELFNGFRATVEGMAGLVFKTPPALDAAADPDTAAEWQNIDGAGSHGAVFLRRLFAEGLTTGRAGILVDYPSVAPGLSLADEQDLGLRPYWCRVNAEQVTSWRIEQRGAAFVFTQLVIREIVVRPLGVFGSTSVVRYRVFRLDPALGVVWQLWEHPLNNPKAKPRVTASGVLRNQRSIPFAPFCPASDGAVWGGEPPLIDLLHLNVAHYRLTGERRYAIHLACAPVPVRVGMSSSARDDEEGMTGPVVLGPTRMMDLPAGASFSWEAPPAGWDAPTKDELGMIEARMAAVGMRLLQQHEGTAAETATAVEARNAPQNARLAAYAWALQDAGNLALEFHARYARRDATTVAVADDFDQIRLTPEQVQAYSALVASGQLSLDTLWKLLAAGNVLPDDFDPRQEKARLANAPGGLDGPVVPVGVPDPADDPADDPARVAVAA